MEPSARLKVPLGDREIPVDAPPGWHVTLAIPKRQPALVDLDAAIAAALGVPLRTPRLEHLAAERVAAARSAGRTATATVVVTDATRDCPDDRFLPPLLDAIHAGGIAAQDTTILVATGLHRASTPAEKRTKLGAAVADSYRVVDHDARDGANIVGLGSTAGGVPATLNRLGRDADLLVATGVVEPHQYAGWSGGAKTVAIGLAGEATIAATHSPRFLDQDGVCLARLDGNPFHAAVVELGRLAGLDFVVNVVLDADGRAIAVAAGEPEAVQHELARRAAPAATVAISRQADIAIAGVGAPKDANLYQATRAVTYLHFAPVPAVRRGGAYVLPATMPEGAGSGVGERRFYEALASAAGEPAGIEILLQRLRQSGAQAGEQRAYIVARVLAEASIVVVGALDPGVPAGAGLHTAATLADGLSIAAELAAASAPAPAASDGIELLVVPHAIRTLPIVAESSAAG